MLTNEQVEWAAAETMVPTAAIRAAALTLCAPRDARTPADVIAVTIRLLVHHRARLDQPPRLPGALQGDSTVVEGHQRQVPCPREGSLPEGRYGSR